MVRPGNLASSSAARGLRTVFLGCAAAAFVVSMAAAQASGSVELRAGVVVDRGAGLVYAMSPEGGIDALALASGNVAWRSAAAHRPISVSPAGLLAQVEPSAPGSLDLALLDASGRMVKSTSLALPDDVEARVTDSLSQRFRVARAAGGATQLLAWQSTLLTPRGALIDDELSVPRRRSGAFLIDPATGTASPATAPPGALAGADVQVPQAQRLAVDGQQYLSADGLHRLASVPGSDGYDWTIYDAKGSRLGSLTNSESFARFVVAGGLIVFEVRPGVYREGDVLLEQPLALRAVSLANGVEQWSAAIRDTEYRGPFPP